MTKQFDIGTIEGVRSSRVGYASDASVHRRMR